MIDNKIWIEEIIIFIIIIINKNVMKLKYKFGFSNKFFPLEKILLSFSIKFLFLIIWFLKLLFWLKLFFESSFNNFKEDFWVKLALEEELLIKWILDLLIEILELLWFELVLLLIFEFVLSLFSFKLWKIDFLSLKWLLSFFFNKFEFFKGNEFLLEFKFKFIFWDKILFFFLLKN